MKEAATTIRQMIASQRYKINRKPTKGQIEAGNYRKGHIKIHGLTISIENGKGHTRSGTDPNGKKWSCTMAHDYGYICGTTGKDKDHIDVFVGPHPHAELAYVVDQQKPDGAFDEHKCMLGFLTEEDARQGYLANYEKGWTGLQKITPLTMAQFKWWLKNGDVQKPVASQRVKAALAAPPKILPMIEKAKQDIPPEQLLLQIMQRARGRRSNTP